MTNQNSTPEYVTREILKEEISASEARLVAKIDQIDVKARDVEKRLDAKIDSRFNQLDAKIDSRFNQLDAKIGTTEQSLKEYTDSRFTRLDVKTDRIEMTVKEQGKKMDVYFQGIVRMVEGVVGKVAIADDRLKDHETRITVLEAKGLQPGRI